MNQSRSNPAAATVLRPSRSLGGVWRRTLRILVYGLLAVGVQVAYMTLLRCFDEASLPFTASFGDVPAKAQGVRVDIEAMSVDVTARSIRLRVAIHPVAETDPPEADIPSVRVEHSGAQAGTAPAITLVAGGEIRTITGLLPQFLVLSANLTEGGNASYPFDQQSTDLSVAAVEVNAAGRKVAVPVVLGFHDALAAYDVRPVQAEVTSGTVQVNLRIRRNLTSVIFTCCFYGIMIIIAGATLTVGTTCALRWRRTELPMTTLFATSLFAVPALRNAMPGAPPLGVRADFLVFLWAELGIATGLLLFLAGWFGSAPQPAQAADSRPLAGPPNNAS